MNFIVEHFNNIACVILMMLGFYIVIQSGNFIKKLMGMMIFQTSVLLFYISASYVEGAHVPILDKTLKNVTYGNPLPHVLMLTAIVVGVATFAVGLAIVVRIKEEYGSIEEDEVLEIDDKKYQKLNKQVREGLED